MNPKNTKAAPGKGRRFDFCKAVAASEIEDITPQPQHQHHRAAHRLAVRFGLTVPTARAVAELAGLGGAHG